MMKERRCGQGSMHRSLVVCSVVLAAAVSVAACGSTDGEDEPRRAALKDLAAHVIVPNYRDLSVAAARMAARAAEFEATPNEASLDALREAWRNARALWKRSQAFEFGPAEELRTGAKIDWVPTRESRVESAIAADGVLDNAYVEDLGSNQKGFLALEYLIFDPLDGSIRVLDVLSSGDCARRRHFVRALCDNLSDQAFQLYDAWRPGGGDFEFELGDAGRGSGTYPTIKSALDELLNQMVFLSEDVADAQLMAAVGLEGEPDPTAIDARRSGSGRRDVLENLISIQNAFLSTYPGRARHSLGELVGLLNADTESAIRASIVQSIRLVAKIPEPLSEAVALDRETVLDAQKAAKEVMRRLEIDLISILGGTLRFNPGDGD